MTQQYGRSKVHPKKFVLWTACASIVMLFAGLTSAYLVRKSQGNWLEFDLPDVFWAGTGAILLSSFALFQAEKSFAKGLEGRYKIFLSAAFVLGMVFLVLQYKGWTAMFQMGVDLKVNPSASFVYVISGVHAAHVLGGLAALIAALIHGFGLQFNPTKARRLRLNLTSTYWHFVDLLWVYLFIFFIIQHN